MPREKIVWLVLVSLLLVGVVISVNSSRTKVVEQVFAKKALPLPQGKERAWVDARLVKDGILGDDSGELFVNPLMIQATKENVFILDWGDRAIKKLSQDGKLLQVYRASRERSSVEAMAPTHFAVSLAREVWACYQQDHRVVRFSEEGEVLHIYQVGHLPHRVIPLLAGGFVVMSGEPGSNLFQLYDEAGRQVKSFGRILEGELQHPLVLDGWIAGGDKLFYASRYAGLLASYSPGGELIYAMQTIDPSPVPNIWINSSGRWKVEPGSPLKALGISVSDGKVFVLNERESRVRNRIIDVYGASDGRYVYSIRLPEAARNSVLVGDYIYTIGNRKVTRWRIEGYLPKVAKIGTASNSG